VRRGAAGRLLRQDQRHRLHRGGDRHANSALHLIVVTRMRVDQRTKDHVARRIAQGHSKLEVIRCRKRDVAREIYLLLKPPTQANVKSRAA
jgi:transposase